jgi:hypothetical protein
VLLFELYRNQGIRISFTSPQYLRYGSNKITCIKFLYCISLSTYSGNKRRFLIKVWTLSCMMICRIITYLYSSHIFSSMPRLGPHKWLQMYVYYTILKSSLRKYLSSASLAELNWDISFKREMRVSLCEKIHASSFTWYPVNLQWSDCDILYVLM